MATTPLIFSPVVYPPMMADPAADPYVTGSLNPSSDKARMRFSDVARFAEEQFKAPLDFRH